ncbi:MAG: hypothetical protein AB8B49_05700 [Nitratireductor sp.]
MTQRLDIKTVRFEPMTDSVLFDGRKIVLAVTKDALEALFNIELSPQEAVYKAIEEEKRLTKLADIIPADDGRVTVTKNMLLNEGQFLDQN